MRPVRTLPPVLLLVLAAAAQAATIDFSGTISYDGTSQGDTLYVAVLDTAGVEDVTLLDVVAIEATAPPFAIPYALQFDNTGVSAQLLIAAFLDVDGGGLSDIQGVDVFGWYAGSAVPTAVSSASSQSNLDFALPKGEIHGAVIFGPGQIEARIDVSPDVACLMEGFRPGTFVFSSGSYSIIGVYPGSYCVSAEGSGDFGYRRICYDDPSCESPNLVVLGDGQAVNGIDFDFSTVKTEGSTWGGIKARFH